MLDKGRREFLSVAGSAAAYAVMTPLAEAAIARALASGNQFIRK